MGNAAERMLGLLLPRSCVFCRKPLTGSGKAMVCPSCAGEARILRFGQDGAPGDIDALCAAYRFEGMIRDAVHRFKYAHKKGYARYFGAQMVSVATGMDWHKSADIITYVPSGWRRVHARGYNPSQLLAAHIAGQMGIPCEKLLVKRPFSKVQSKKSKEERAQNAKKSFGLRKNLSLEGKTILIVDDVVTTGATLSACAGLLRQAGAGHIYALCAAKTPWQGKKTDK